ncbi:MAG: replication-relaxation family protein [Kangiellaceae bacterium]|nr:replication-relaxation family protein [Kangiellaceae bacterium]
MGKVLLTEGDIEALWWVWMLQVLSLDQIRRLRYFQEETGKLSHPDNVRKRLSRLAKAEYLIGDELWEEYSRKRMRIYRIGAAALPPLSYHFGVEQTRVHRPKAQNVFRQVHHTLLVSECAVRIVESLRGSDFEVPRLPPVEVPFYQTHMVGNPRSKKHVERFVSQEDIWVPTASKPHRIRPDLVFALGKEGAHRLFFLEADRGTESHAEIAAKQKGYACYAKAPDPDDPRKYLWQRYGAMRDFRVLLVTTTERRIKGLRSSLQNEPGFELMAFTTEEQLQHSNMAMEAIWTVPNGEQHPLLKSE